MEGQGRETVRRMSLSAPLLPVLQAGAKLGDSSDDEQDSSSSDEDRPPMTHSKTVPYRTAERGGAADFLQKLEEDPFESSERPTVRQRRRDSAGLVTLSRRAAAELRVQVEESLAQSESTGSWVLSDNFCRESSEDPFGAPAPKVSSVERTPEMLDQRANAINKVSSMSKKYAETLERQRENAKTRRKKRLQTAPSLIMADVCASVDEAPSVARSPSMMGGEPDISPVIIFDWDDTILPTWYITEVIKPCTGKEGQVTPDSPHYELLAAHAQVARATLCAAREVARVAIVTLARRPWVETSSELYLPGFDHERLFQELEIEIYYAREHMIKFQVYTAQVEDGVDMFTIAKRNAMMHALRRVYGSHSSRSMHVLSVGDSPAEHEAIKEVIWCCTEETDSLCKTVKLMSDPSVQHLSAQLNVLISWFYRMVCYNADFDVSMETEEGMERITKTILTV